MNSSDSETERRVQFTDPSPVLAPSRTWPAWASVFAPRDAATRVALMDRFLALLHKSAPGILDGAGEVNLSSEQHAEVLRELRVTARNLDEDRRLTRWWEALVEAGNRVGRWQIEFSAPRVALPPLRPVFVRRDFQILTRYRAIEAAFFGRLADRQLDLAALKSAWLLSAIMFGGIISRDRFCALLAADLSQLRSERGLVWIPLSIDSASASVRTIVWYPDALTAGLLARCGVDPDRPATSYPDWIQASRKPSAWSRAIPQLLSDLGLPIWPSSESDFLRAAEVSARLELPAFTVGYLAGDNVCHSLPEAVRARLAGWEIEQPLQVESNPATSVRGELQGFDVTYDRSRHAASQRAVLAAAVKVLRGGGKPIRRLAALQAEHVGELWPITQTLIEWAKWLLGPNGLDRRPVAKSTVRTYLDIVGKRLMMIVEDDDLFDYEPEDFESLYELAADRVRSTAQRARFWGRIRLFHDFLFLCGAPDVELRELDGFVQGGGHRVSANVIGEREFRIFKQGLVEKIKLTQSRALKMILLAGICGYRLGLRRRETQMIHLSDIHSGLQPYLLVRPSRLAALKTYSARRQLPLSVLLPDDELKFFDAFVAERKLQEGDSSGLLLAEIGAPSVPLPVEQLFDPVTAMFKAICGTQAGSFRFHHLRHSFANWLLVALLASDDQKLIEHRPSFVDSAMLEIEQRKKIREGLFPRLAGTVDPPGRRHLYQVASLMGHLSPETTLKCYVHILDWIAARSLDMSLHRDMADWSPSQLGSLCGISHAMAYREPYKAFSGDPVGFLRRFAASRLPRSVAVRAVKNLATPDLTPVFEQLRPSAIPSVLEAMTILQRYYAGAPVSWLTKVFALQPAVIETGIKSYERLYAKQSSAQTKRSFSTPHQPRTHVDRDEFWRIVEASERSFSERGLRSDMLIASEALIRRIGPRTGSIRFGKRLDQADAIARGLLAMGLDIDQLTLTITTHKKGSVILKPSQWAIKAVTRLGINTRTEIKSWKKRRIDQAHLRLDIAVRRKINAKQTAHWGGRIAALNYCAMWVQMASMTAAITEGAGDR